MATPDILKKEHYDIGDSVFIGIDRCNSFSGIIISERTDDTYLINTSEMIIRIHNDSILGIESTFEEMYFNLKRIHSETPRIIINFEVSCEIPTEFILYLMRCTAYGCAVQICDSDN